MSWVFELLAAFAAALFLRLFVVSLARIKGRSMLPTLQDRDVALVWRLLYLFRTPRRGDVVICHYPGRRMKRLPFIPQAFVKRVIGLPGDTVEWLEGELLLNGQPLREPYLDPARCRFKRTRPPRTLGPDEYYVLGDNRDSSNDSRSVGPIRRRAIRGRVVCLIYRRVQ
ncbi:MAG: signal peptidase I [Clostridia bacterium]|nr:signal peptidase I [Clostridia bacterium]